MALTGWLETTAQDLRFALRTLRRQRGLSAVIVLTLALAIGANTAIFSLMDVLLLQALPVRDPQHLLLLQWSAHNAPDYEGSSSYGDCLSRYTKANSSSCSFSLPFYQELGQQAHSLAAITAAGGGGAYNLSGHGQASIANVQVVAGNYFSTLGVRPALGRLLEPSDDTAAAPLAMVLNYAYWRSAFAASPAVVGETVALNHVPVTIVGVASPRFTSLTPGAVYNGWLPLAARPRLTPGWSPSGEDAGSIWLTLLARLRPGVALGQAQAEVSGLFRNAMLAGAKPFSKPGDDPRVALESAQTSLRGVRGQFTQPLAVLMWTVGAILLIACANIAGLLLGRASARQKELALRRALGAGGGRILRQLLTESLLLAALGGVAGLLLAYGGARWLLAVMSSASYRPLGMQVSLDARVVLFTLGATLATGVLFGLAPGLRGARGDLTRSLKDGVGNSAAGHRHRWLHLGNGLVVMQIALCMVVLAGAGLLVRTLANLRAVNPGFDTRNLLMFELEPALIGYKGAAVDRLYQQLQQRIGALPGVGGVSYSESPLLSGDLSETSFHIQKGGPEVNTDWLPVGLNFFATMHLPLRLGRDFVPSDFVPQPDTPAAAAAAQKAPPGRPRAVIVNQAFAQKYLGGGDPVGRIIGAGDQSSKAGFVVVGVVANALYQGLRDKVAPTTYVPSSQGYANFEVRSAGDPMALLPAVRRVLRRVDANLPLSHPTTQTASVDRILFRERLMAELSSCFAGLALLLACIGLYGLLAQEVTRRTREIGIRMALGAERGHVLRLVVGLGVALAMAGLGLGVAGAWALTRYLQSMLFGVGATDPMTLAGVGALLLVVALAACLVPARRATRVDPLVALRCE
ncbi:MAG TPA: ABC transporter permease [Terriglobales bacterium]|nr:ABC transporter permease [Terriglobales bacterium]